MNTNIFPHIFMAPGYNSPSVTCWYLVRLLPLAHVCVANTVRFENNLDCGSVFFANSQQSQKKCTVWVSSLQFSGLHLYHISWYYSLLVPLHVTGVVMVEWLQWIPMTPWFKHTLPVKKKKKKGDCSASGFHWFLREITEPQQVVTSNSGMCC